MATLQQQDLTIRQQIKLFLTQEFKNGKTNDGHSKEFFST